MRFRPWGPDLDNANVGMHKRFLRAFRAQSAESNEIPPKGCPVWGIPFFYAFGK